MSEAEESPTAWASSPRRPPAGLCDTCTHQRLIHNTRGSVFSMCDRSRSDPAYPRYPRLPVLDCAGHEPRPQGTDAPQGPP